jgi:hypothetical protein
MLSGSRTPWAIIIGEFVMCVCFAILARAARRPGVIHTTTADVLVGVSPDYS